MVAAQDKECTGFNKSCYCVSVFFLLKMKWYAAHSTSSPSGGCYWPLSLFSLGYWFQLTLNIQVTRGLSTLCSHPSFRRFTSLWREESGTGRLKRFLGYSNIQPGWNCTQWFFKTTWSLALVSKCSGSNIFILRNGYLYPQHHRVTATYSGSFYKATLHYFALFLFYLRR